MKTPTPRSVRVILTLLCGVALLLLAAPARAQIAIVDNASLTASTFNNTSTSLALSSTFTVSASANTLVVVVTWRDSTAAIEAPATLGWGNGTVSQTLTLAVVKESKAASGGRCSAIYYLYNPTAGTGFNISGNLSGQTGSSGSSGALVAYTLSGVDTTVVPPPTGFASETSQASDSSISTTINNITANSWAAVGGVIAESDGVHTINATNNGAATGTQVLTTDTAGFSSTSTAAMGYISSIAGGSDTFTYSFTADNTDTALAAAVFAPTAAPTITSQPQNASAFSGGAATGVFSVAANGTSLSYQWYTTSSGTLPLVSPVTLHNGSKYSGATSSTLSISNVVSSDLTYYAVVVTGSSVSVTSSVVTLSSVPLANQVGDVISVKMAFLASYSANNPSLNATDVAGAVPLTNWNNFIGNTAWPASQGTNNLQDNAGVNTGAGLTTFGLDNAWHNSGSITTASSPNAKLLNGEFESKTGVANFFTFTNLPTIGNYDVYVYLGSENSGGAQDSIQCINNGVTYYQLAPPGPVTNNQVLAEGANTTSGTYPGCNYVVFRGVTPATLDNGLNAISIVTAPSPLTGDNGGVAGVQLVPSGAGPTYLSILQQPQPAYIISGGNATFTVNADGNPPVSSYQWYQISGGTTNLITGATAGSFTTNNVTMNGTSYFVVVGNGSTTVTSSVAPAYITVNGIWNTSSGSWANSGNWVGNAIANGGGIAWCTNDQGGTITLDDTPGFTVGTNIFGITGAVSPQTPWVINSGSPAGTLTMADSGTASVTGNGTAPVVTAVPMIEVYSNNPVTINAPLAGTQGLNVVGGGTLVLAGGNTNNTYTGNTVIGANNSTDTTALQIGNGGTSGAIDFTHTIFLCACCDLIFNRSDTIVLTSSLNDQAGKAPNLIVKSGTVVWAPQSETSPYDGAIVNNGGTLVFDCPVGVYAIGNTAGTVTTNGLPNTPAYDGGANGGNVGGLSLGINSGGVVQLAGVGGNGVNIQPNNGVLDNGIFDLGGDNIELGLITGAGIVTNSGSTLATLDLAGGDNATLAPAIWSGTIADGTTAQTAVTISGGTTTYTGANTYTGGTLLSGGMLILSNSASLNSANIIVSGANLYLVNTPTITNPYATISVGSGRTLDVSGLAGNFSLNAGQTLVVTNTGLVNAGANTVIAASGSTLVPGGNGTAGTMTINGNLTLNGNTNLYDLATLSTEGGGINDEIVGVTNLTLSGNITIEVNTGFNNTFNPSTTYKLIKYSGTLANTATFTVIPSAFNGNPNTIDAVSQPGYVLLKTGGSSPPVITISPTNIDAFTGYPVTLPVSESGSTPITNQWFNGATPVPGATSANYTLTPMTPGVYTYTLWATNAYGTGNASVTVNVGSPTISIQCTYQPSYVAGALYLAPTDTAGAYAVSNWNVWSVVPNGPGRISSIETGISLTTPVDTNGFATPVTVTVVGVNDGYHEALTITTNDTANARMMNTYWYANPIETTPASTNITFTVTNLPNDTYDVYVYLLQQVSSGTHGNVEVYDSTTTNYMEYGEDFSSTSNFVTAIDNSPTDTPYPYANYAELRISTGGSNSISFTESGTGNGVGGSGVCGVQIVPVPPSAPRIVHQPLSQRVVTNLTATFTVQANGFPLAYQWYSISLGGMTNALAGATNTSYTTLPVQDSDTGTGYFVVVSNYLGQVTSSTAILTVGHMVTASGLLIDNQFYDTGLNLIDTFIDIYPGSAWLLTTQPNNVEYPNTLDVTNDLAIEPPPYISEAERIYGWFTPAVSGDYVFFVASDDAGALYLSTNDAPTNSYLVAQNEADMAAQDWTCSNTGTLEYTTYFSSGEFRSDVFINGAQSGTPYESPLNEYNPGGWVQTPNYNPNDGGITLVAGTPYYIELDNYYGGANNQNAGVNYKLAGQPDPNPGSASLLTGANISASVPDSALPVPQPTITNITMSGSNVILTGTNGLLNAAYYVLSTTNLTTPLANWTVGPLSVFDVNGNFINTNAVGAKATFYQLQVP